MGQRSFAWRRTGVLSVKCLPSNFFEKYASHERTSARVVPIGAEFSPEALDVDVALAEPAAGMDLVVVL